MATFIEMSTIDGEMYAESRPTLGRRIGAAFQAVVAAVMNIIWNFTAIQQLRGTFLRFCSCLGIHGRRIWNTKPWNIVLALLLWCSDKCQYAGSQFWNSTLINRVRVFLVRCMVNTQYTALRVWNLNPITDVRVLLILCFFYCRHTGIRLINSTTGTNVRVVLLWFYIDIQDTVPRIKQFIRVNLGIISASSAKKLNLLGSILSKLAQHSLLRILSISTRTGKRKNILLYMLCVSVIAAFQLQHVDGMSTGFYYYIILSSCSFALLLTWLITAHKFSRCVFFISFPSIIIKLFRYSVLAMLISLCGSGPISNIESVVNRLTFSANCSRDLIGREVSKASMVGINAIENAYSESIGKFVSTLESIGEITVPIEVSVDFVTSQVNYLAEESNKVWNNCVAGARATWDDCYLRTAIAKENCENGLGLINGVCEVVDVGTEICKKLDNANPCQALSVVSDFSHEILKLKSYTKKLKDSFRVNKTFTKSTSLIVTRPKAPKFINEYKERLAYHTDIVVTLKTIFGPIFALRALYDPIANAIFLGLFLRNPQKRKSFKLFGLIWHSIVSISMILTYLLEYGLIQFDHSISGDSKDFSTQIGGSTQVSGKIEGGAVATLLYNQIISPYRLNETQQITIEYSECFPTSMISSSFSYPVLLLILLGYMTYAAEFILLKLTAPMILYMYPEIESIRFRYSVNIM